MKILVSGGAGFIGSHVTDLLIKEGHNVIIIDNLSSGKIENINPRAKFYNQDIGNHEKIKEIFESEMPEIVYHLAAQIDVRKSVENPVYDAEINIINTLKLLELAIKHRIKHFIFSSTGGALYHDKETLAYEDSLINPISPYGCAKLAIENYLKFYNHIYGLKFTILRYSNVYGPRQNGKGEAGVIAIFFENLFSGKKPIIYGGIQKRDFVYVEDVARANLLALQDNKSDIYNVSTGTEIDVIEIFSKINRYFKNKFEPEYKELRKGEKIRSCLNWEKIKNSLGWKPFILLDEGLDKTYCWYIRELEKLQK